MTLNDMRKIEIKIDNAPSLIIQLDESYDFTTMSIGNMTQEEFTQLLQLLHKAEKSFSNLKDIQDFLKGEIYFYEADKQKTGAAE